MVTPINEKTQENKDHFKSKSLVKKSLKNFLKLEQIFLIGKSLIVASSP